MAKEISNTKTWLYILSELFHKDMALYPPYFQVYQAFSFIAWTEATIEPIILICFDRNLNLLARFLYCDRDHYTAAQIAFLMAQNRESQATRNRHPPHPPHAAHNHLQNHLPPPPPPPHQHPHRNHSHLTGDEDCEEFGAGNGTGGGACAGGSEDTEEAMALQNSIELGGEAFHENRARKVRQGVGGGPGGGRDSLGRGGHAGMNSMGRVGAVSPLTNSLLPAPPAPPCRHCSPVTFDSEVTPLRPRARYGSGGQRDSSSSATRELRGLTPERATSCSSLPCPCV